MSSGTSLAVMDDAFVTRVGQAPEALRERGRIKPRRRPPRHAPASGCKHTTVSTMWTEIVSKVFRSLRRLPWEQVRVAPCVAIGVFGNAPHLQNVCDSSRIPIVTTTSYWVCAEGLTAWSRCSDRERAMLCGAPCQSRRYLQIGAVMG